MRYEVGRFGAFLATRDKGAKIREDLEKRLKGQGEGAVTISFGDVQAVTISFLDEFAGKLIGAHAVGDVTSAGLVFTELNSDVREALDICLDRRDFVAAERRGRRFGLLGSDSFLAETFDEALHLKEFRASDISEAMGISAQNANNRLRKLVACGALRRVRSAPDSGGKEFIYTLPAI